MKVLLSLIFICLISFPTKAEVTLKAKTAEEKDLGCITLLKLASEKVRMLEKRLNMKNLKA